MPMVLTCAVTFLSIDLAQAWASLGEAKNMVGDQQVMLFLFLSYKRKDAMFAFLLCANSYFMVGGSKTNNWPVSTEL